MDNLSARWQSSTEMLRGLEIAEGQANAWLLDQGRDRWAGTVLARTSLASLLFTLPGATHYGRRVLVSWRGDVYEFQFLNPSLVTADRCFAKNAPAVLDAFLYQLAGDAAPE